MTKGKFETISVKLIDLFMNQNKYVVPPFQRDYSWDKDQIEILWQDIVNSKDDKDYFFGSIVMLSSEEKDDEFIVIDGQQRLATITILLAAIRDTLISKGDTESAFSINSNYIIKTLERDSKIPKITLNERNNEIFYNCIQLMSSDAERKDFAQYPHLEKTNQYIKNTYKIFLRKIDENIAGMNDDDASHYLNGFCTHIRKTLSVITITVQTEDEAYLIFETINYRGLELSVSDLIKNYLIRKAKNPSDRRVIIDLWYDIAKILDDKIRPFLRHYWLSKHEQVTERNLFSKMKNHIESKRVNVRDFVAELKSEALVYNALQNQEYDIWKDKSILSLIKNFTTLNVKLCLPVLLSAHDKFSEKEFKKLLEKIIIFTFRFSTICNLHNNVLISKYSEIAIAIRKSTIKNTKAVFELLKENYPDQLAFESSFQKKGISDNKLAKYVLMKMDSYIGKYSEKIDYESLSIEHVIPKNPDEEWKKYFVKRGYNEEKIDDLKLKIGNLTLLDIDMNRKARNQFFTKKRDNYYKKSNLWLNSKLKVEKEWDEKAINKRQIELSKLAEEVWKIHFSKSKKTNKS